MPIGNYTIDRSPPAVGANQGDLWFDLSNNVLNVHNGVGFVPLSLPASSAAVNASTCPAPALALLPLVTGSFGATVNVPSGHVGLAYDPVGVRLWAAVSGSLGLWRSVLLA